MSLTKCIECKYAKSEDYGAKRYNVFCRHPNQKYIIEYCMKNRVGKMPGFICFTKPFDPEPTIKTSPKWCPLKVEEE